LATDKELYYYDEWGDTEPAFIYGPVHAWRALAQLQAAAAIEPLVSMLDDFDDWVYEDMPQVLALFGPAAIPALQSYLFDKEKDEIDRHLAGKALVAITQKYPQARAACLKALSETLADPSTEGELAGFMVEYLVELKGLEALPVIEQAFKEARVDTTMITWDLVQIKLGLKTREEIHQERLAQRGLFAPGGLYIPQSGPPVRLNQHPTSTKAKTKAKRKISKESKRKNRQRK
jgi:hypothetical protein